jgi:hypothetical protein
LVTTLLLAKPSTVDDDPDAEAVVLRIDDVLHAPVTGEDELVAITIDPDVGVSRPGLFRRSEGSVCQVAELIGWRAREQHGRRTRAGGGAKRDQ